MGGLANEAIRRLRQEREATLQALLPLEDEDCRASAHLYGAQRSVNFVLRAFSSHALDHLQHAQRLLATRGVRQREAQLLLMKAQALLAELEVMLLGLSDEDFAAIGPNEGDWSAQQIVDHFIEIERRYREVVIPAVEQQRSAAPTGG